MYLEDPRGTDLVLGARGGHGAAPSPHTGQRPLFDRQAHQPILSGARASADGMGCSCASSRYTSGVACGTSMSGVSASLSPSSSRTWDEGR